MDFLGLSGKTVVVFGVANRRSVAYHVANLLREYGVNLVFSVLGEEQQRAVVKQFPESPVFRCDVSDEEQIRQLADDIRAMFPEIYGLIHSIAYANYSEGIKPFHETVKADFLEAIDISCFSFINLAKYFSPFMAENGSMVTISISTTRMAAVNYGYMAPIKAALDSSICFLAKSLSASKNIRVNGVGASLLKTSASAGIPGYIEPYLFAEKATLRKQALRTEEVANVAGFLLSARASGINAQTIVVDAGMSTNFFDQDIVNKVVD